MFVMERGERNGREGGQLFLPFYLCLDFTINSIVSSRRNNKRIIRGIEWVESNI